MKTEEHYYDVNVITLHTVEAGEKGGIPIIFLHGFPEFWYGWKNQLTFFADKGYRVIIPDQRGYNLSSKPAHVQSYTLNNLCGDIVALIDKLTDKRVIVVGHDWGGVVAWRLAIDYPHLIRSLVIINMPHPEVFSQALKTNPVQMFRSSYAAFFQLPRLPEWIICAFGFALLRRSLVRTSNKGTFTKEDFAEYKEAWQKREALSAMINWYRAYKYNKLPAPVLIQLPVLLIWGENDAYLITKMASESIAKCKNGKLEIIKGATHWVHHEQSQLVNKLIHDFVSKGSKSL